MKKFLVSLIAVFSILSITVFAKVYSENITRYYNNIKIKIDGVTITPKDANGNIVEPFTIDGTTYLPVRAIAEALNMEVTWYSDTNTVWLKTASNSSQSLSSTKYNENSTNNKIPDVYIVEPSTYAEGVRDNNKPVVTTPTTNYPKEDKTFYLNHAKSSIQEQMNAKGMLDSSMTTNMISSAQSEVNSYSVAELTEIVYYTQTDSYFHQPDCKALFGNLNTDLRYKLIAKGRRSCPICGN